MIISEFVSIRISTSNKDHFEKLGYKVKLNEYADIKVCHLKPNSMILIEAECDVCHQKKKIRYDVYMRKPLFSCSYKCAGQFYFAKSQQTFIEQVNKLYGDDLDFSESIYVNNHSSVIVKCKKHGYFEMPPRDLINERGCTKCNKEKLSEKRYELFISAAKLLHNNKYTYPDYSNSNFINSNTKITICCPIHGDFSQSSTHHLQLHGCHKCANIRKRLKKIEVISRNKFEGNPVFPSYNKKACNIFDKICEQKHIHIQHALNDGEFYIKELGYWLDGYDIKNNTVYEFDEKYHFIKGQLREKDIDRQNEIEKFLGCKFIRIKDL